MLDDLTQVPKLARITTRPHADNRREREVFVDGSHQRECRPLPVHDQGELENSMTANHPRADGVTSDIESLFDAVAQTDRERNKRLMPACACRQKNRVRPSRRKSRTRRQSCRCQPDGLEKTRRGG